MTFEKKDFLIIPVREMQAEAADRRNLRGKENSLSLGAGVASALPNLWLPWRPRALLSTDMLAPTAALQG